MSSLTWLNQEIQLMAQQYAAELVSIKNRISNALKCIFKINVDFHKLLESEIASKCTRQHEMIIDINFVLESENSTEMHWNAQKQRRFS